MLRLTRFSIKPLVSVRAFSETTEVALKPKKKQGGMGKNRPCLVKQNERNGELEKRRSEKNLEWRLMGATILTRYPAIAKEPEQWEKDMIELQEKIEDKKRAWLVEQVKGTSADFIPHNNPTYEEILSTMPFKPASRTTEADLNNDRKSTERRLADTLYFVVKRNRADHAWQFPQGKWLAEETMRQTAERVVDRAVGKVDRWFVGNAPTSHYRYEYPSDVQAKRNNFGAMTFFYRAKLIEGSVKLETKLYKDYAWIAKDELHEYFDADYVEFLKHALP